MINPIHWKMIAPYRKLFEVRNVHQGVAVHWSKCQAFDSRMEVPGYDPKGVRR